jgi:hypothetical protein
MDKYTKRLLLNFYNFFEIDIPEDFNNREKLIEDIKKIPLKYLNENVMDISIDELYDEYHYLNKTKSSQLLYYRNIICITYRFI